MSSKRSPATGSKRSPSRTDDVVRSLSSIVSVARATARGLTSEATTRRAVRCGVHRLDAAAGAEVEGGVDRPADRRPGEGSGRGADAEHVVGGDGAGRAGPIVGDEPIVGVAERSDHDRAP